MKLVTIGAVALVAAGWAAQPARSGNPILPGWYADPEAHVFERQYWIYPTYSAPYDEQTFLDAFSSPDLITWTKHPRILDAARIPWARRAVWAPSIVENDGWYYLFFGANDIQSDKEVGGIGIARSRRPEGPFEDYLGKPLIDRFHNGAQPIDQHVFRDADGSYYIIYGGWRRCNIAKLNADFTGLVPFDDGTVFREITPRGYVEGAFMLLRDGKYYFMWSEGGWTGPNYAVAYAIGDSPFGPFERIGRILEQDPSVATGAGHHSVVTSPRSGRSYIVYHRRPLDRKDRNHRVVSIEELHFDEDGRIVPVVLTNEGVAADPLTPPGQPTRSRLDLRPCPQPDSREQFPCGTFAVPLDRSQPGGPTLTLKVVVVPALPGNPDAPPLFLLAGGPGVPITGAAAELATPKDGELPAALAGVRRRTLVLVDQRGVGGSNDLGCTAHAEKAGLAAVLSDMLPPAVIAACRQDQPAIAAHYSTESFVADLDELSEALG